MFFSLAWQISTTLESKGFRKESLQQLRYLILIVAVAAVTAVAVAAVTADRCCCCDCWCRSCHCCVAGCHSISRTLHNFAVVDGVCVCACVCQTRLFTIVRPMIKSAVTTFNVSSPGHGSVLVNFMPVPVTSTTKTCNITIDGETLRVVCSLNVTGRGGEYCRQCSFRAFNTCTPLTCYLLKETRVIDASCNRVLCNATLLGGNIQSGTIRIESGKKRDKELRLE